MAVRTQLPVQLVPAAGNNRGARLPNVLVLHYTHCSLTEAFAHYQQGNVSAHYTVDRNGDIYQHVDELEAAHHAGLSYWHRASVNQSSIGIEIVNAGPLGPCDEGSDHSVGSFCSGGLAWEPFAEQQYLRVIALSQDIVERYAIDPFDVVGHADVAPERKEDPGPAFPWLRLAQAGIGVAYDAARGMLVHGREEFPLQTARPRPISEIQQQLASLGYAVPQDGTDDVVTSRTLLAFNSHYLGRFDDKLSADTRAVLEALWQWRRERQTATLTARDNHRRAFEANASLESLRGSSPSP